VTDSLSLSFPREPDSVPAARAALARYDDRLPESVLYDASLCLSELVTNAIQHPAVESEDDLELRLELRQDALRVDVIDPGQGFEPGPPTQGDQRGWGLYIVDQLSTRWGTEPGERTAIWFEIAHGGDSTASQTGHARLDARDDPRDPRDGELAYVLGRLRPLPAIQ